MSPRTAVLTLCVIASPASCSWMQHVRAARPDASVASSQPTAATAVTPTSKAQHRAAQRATDAHEPQVWWQALLDVVVDVSAAVVVPVLTAFLWVIGKRISINLERDTIEWIVSKAVGFGEQHAKRALRSGSPMAGNEIFKRACTHGKQLLVTKGLAKKWGDGIGDLIEAKLGEKEASKHDVLSKTAEAHGVKGT